MTEAYLFKPEKSVYFNYFSLELFLQCIIHVPRFLILRMPQVLIWAVGAMSSPATEGVSLLYQMIPNSCVFLWLRFACTFSFVLSCHAWGVSKLLTSYHNQVLTSSWWQGEGPLPVASHYVRCYGIRKLGYWNWIENKRLGLWYKDSENSYFIIFQFLLDWRFEFTQLRFRKVGNQSGQKIRLLWMTLGKLL